MEVNVAFFNYDLKMYAFNIPIITTNNTMLVSVMALNAQEALDMEYDRIRIIHGAN
jgi:hypothetical protein